MRKKDWELTPEAFNGLLARFDPDAERAGQRYELIRAEVIKFFECRGCFTPRDLADETINRVARKITEGEEIQPGAIQSYFYGVARNVFREYVRSPEKETPHVEAMRPSEHPSVNPVDLNLRRADRVRLERRLECLESCVAQLSPETRSLITSYYEGEEGVKIANRKRMAEALGITLNNLRIHIHRIRKKLERCVAMCVNATGD